MPITASTAIQRNFLAAKWYAEMERIDEAQNKLDLYMDDYEAIVRAKMSELYHKDNYKRLYYHVNQSQNILKRVINEISTIYKVEPQRELSKESDRYAEIAEETNLNVKMKKVNRYTNLMNESLLKIGVRSGQIVYDILTPNICMVIQNEEDTTKADAIIYQVTRKNTQGDAGIDYHYWDVEGNYYVFDKDFKIKGIEYDGDSPYRDRNGRFVLPFVVFHKQEPDDTFWDQDSGRDLYNAAVLLGVKMTQFDYYFKTASHKQIYVVGDDVNVPPGQVLDPLTVFTVTGENASAGTLNLQGNLEQLRNALVYQVNSIINNYGISADQWTFSYTNMSGVALKIRNMPLIEIRQDQIPLYRQYERELFEKTRIVNNAWPRLFKKIPEKIEFSIDFGEIEFPDSPEEELKLWTHKLRLGTISLGQFYMHFNPDIQDEKEAEKMIVENLKKFQEVKEKNPEIDEYLSAIMKTTIIEGEKRPEEEEEEE